MGDTGHRGHGGTGVLVLVLVFDLHLHVPIYRQCSERQTELDILDHRSGVSPDSAHFACCATVHQPTGVLVEVRGDAKGAAEPVSVVDGEERSGGNTNEKR